MRKDKSWIVDLFDIEHASKKIEQIANAEFWTTDSNAFLNFTPLQQDFDFDTASIALENKDDGSLINVEAAVENNEASYGLTEDIMLRFGRWTAQVIFVKDDERYTSPLINFDIRRHLLDGRIIL